MKQGYGTCVILFCMTILGQCCQLIHRPDCAVLPPGSFHPHEARCEYFYRCNEFGDSVVYSCPVGKRFLNRNGGLCVPAAQVTCNRCSQPSSRCGDCGCSPTTPPPCLTTTPPPCSIQSTTVITESPTWLPSTTSVSTTASPSPVTESPTWLPSTTSVATTASPSPVTESPTWLPSTTSVSTTASPSPVTESPTWLPSTTVVFTLTTPPFVSMTTERVPKTTTERYTSQNCDPTPNCDNSPPGTVHPYPPDCSKFLYCDFHNVTELVSCYRNKHFSPVELRCMSIETANCPFCIPDHTLSEVTTVSTYPLPECPPVPSCVGSLPGDLKPYPPDCSLYIYCASENDGLLSSCQHGAHFSPHILTCTYPEIANCPLCVASTETTSVVTTTEVIPDCSPTPNCIGTSPGDLKPYPPDCNLFITCESEYNPILTLCPAGDHFSPYTLECTSVEMANCPVCFPGYTTVPTPVPVCPPIPTCDNISMDGKLQPYPPDCTKYIQCISNSIYIIKSCPIGQKFSPYELKCKILERADCPLCVTTQATTPVIITTTETIQTLPSTIPPPVCPPPRICDAPALVVMPQKEPYPPDCTKYIYCYDRQEPYMGSCESGLHFSATLAECVSPDIARCTNCVQPQLV